MLFHIYNLRMARVGQIDATDAKDALRYATERWPGASVERWLSAQEQRQKERAEEAAFWDQMKM